MPLGEYWLLLYILGNLSMSSINVLRIIHIKMTIFIDNCSLSSLIYMNIFSKLSKNKLAKIDPNGGEKHYIFCYSWKTYDSAKDQIMYKD